MHMYRHRKEGLCVRTGASGSLHGCVSAGTYLDAKTGSSYKVSLRWTAHE